MNTPTLRALALFDEYLTLPVARRATALASLQDEDPDTHRMLQRLLASDMALDAGEQADLLDQVTETLVAPTRSSASARATPSSSASIRAFSVQRTVEAQRSSPARTTGPSGSLEATSDRITCSLGLVSTVRAAARAEMSALKASQSSRL